MDRDTFSDRIREAQDQLYRIACSQLREPQDRADAVQEAIFKAWKNRFLLKNEAYFRTWLIRILINECHNIQRAGSRCIPTDSFPEQAYMPEEGGELREAIWQLEEKLRLPVLLYYIEGYDTREAARMLRIPHGTLCSRLKAARKALRLALERKEEDEG